MILAIKFYIGYNIMVIMSPILERIPNPIAYILKVWGKH